MINKSYKHWMIVFFMCCLAASSIGLCTNAIGVFYTPVAKSLKVLKGTFAMHATLSTLATALTLLKISKVIKKYSYKKVLLIGVILSSGATWLMSYSTSVYLFYILGILRGIGVGIYGMVPITVVITNWFDKKHGLATSLALSFSGLSGAIFSPLFMDYLLWLANDLSFHGYLYSCFSSSSINCSLEYRSSKRTFTTLWLSK